jgi:hypothetical protein
MTHAELQAEVTARCDKKKLWWFHANDHPGNRRGWVDLVILGRRGGLFAELKSADGRRTVEQIRCAHHIAGAGLQYRLWHPADLDDGTIDRELEAIR